MPFPNNTFGKELDPSEMAKKSVQSRGAYYQWSRLTRCNNKCPFFDNGCFYQATSHSREMAGKCALKAAPESMQRRVVRVLTGDRDDWVTNILETLQKLDFQLSKSANNPQETKILLDQQLKVFQALFGTKQENINKNMNYNITPQDILDNIDKKIAEAMEHKDKEEKNDRRT